MAKSPAGEGKRTRDVSVANVEGAGLEEGNPAGLACCADENLGDLVRSLLANEIDCKCAERARGIVSDLSSAAARGGGVGVYRFSDSKLRCRAWPSFSAWGGEASMDMLFSLGGPCLCFFAESGYPRKSAERRPTLKQPSLYLVIGSRVAAARFFEQCALLAFCLLNGCYAGILACFLDRGSWLAAGVVEYIGIIWRRESWTLGYLFRLFPMT